MGAQEALGAPLRDEGSERELDQYRAAYRSWRSGSDAQHARLRGNLVYDAAKKAAAPAKKRTPNAAFMKALTPSAALAAIVGSAPLPRTDVTKKVWEYIKKNKLQDELQKRVINADAKLKEIFGKAKADMFEMTKLINSHLK